MAGTVTVSQFSSLTTLRSSLSLSLSPNYTFSPPSFHLSKTISPKLTCHAKLNKVEEWEEINGDFFEDDDLIEDESDDEEGEEDTESSVDLLYRFVLSMYKKVSKRAKKASRSILPSVISPQLVSFAVDGVFLLASLSILKALLEVVCSIGGTIFVAILLLRVTWAAVSYFQSNGNDFNQSGTSYSRAQPVT